jgi:hypothetical protein
MVVGQGRTKYAECAGVRIGVRRMTETRPSADVSVPALRLLSEPQPARKLRTGSTGFGRPGQLPSARTEPMRLLHTKDAVVTREQRERLVLDGDVSDVRHRNGHGFTAEARPLVPVKQRPYVTWLHETSTCP